MEDINPKFIIRPYGTQGRTKKFYYYTCPICKKESLVDERVYKKKILTNEECASCIRSKLCKEMITNRLNSMTDEQRKENITNLHNGLKSYRENLSQDEINQIKKIKSENTSKQMIERWKDDNYRNKRSHEVSIQMSERWSKMDDASRLQILTSLHNGRDKFFNNKDSDDYKNRSKKISEKLQGNHNFDWNQLDRNTQNKIIDRLNNAHKQYLDNLTEEERNKITQTKKDIWNKLSDNEKSRRIDILMLGHKNWINNMSPEDKISISKIHSKLSLDYWNSLTDDERYRIISKSFSRNNTSTSMNDKFEDMFNHSILVNQFKYVNELLLSNGSVTHSWDYGIYNKSNDELVAVVDLDGEYFHADKCDYDGIHSKEEYDEKRSLSVSNDIKIFIITEMNFKKSFESMIQLLLLDYDKYIEYLFNMCRNMPFPAPKYTDIELIKSYQNLCKMDCNQSISLNTRMGDRIIIHFHESIYQSHVKGSISPYDAWYNDELLMKVIKNRIIYQSYLNPNKILQGFNISKVAQKVSVFSAGRARLLINHYLSKYNEIFDPFSGFSGRMLGTISLGKTYIGSDISPIHVRESNSIISFLSQYYDINVNIVQADINNLYGEYECLFTCPPYSDKEQWLDVPISTNTCDDWINICLSHFKCKKYLFVVDNTDKYQDYVVNEIINKSHMNTNHEQVVLINN